MHATEMTRLITEFGDALNAHDVDGMMTRMTEDVLFENTSPAPDGERFEGQAAVRGFWERFFEAAPTARIDTEELICGEDTCTALWRYDWGSGHIRGIDLFRVRDGRISAKISYVKG